jgi:NADH-quinone oxidoreductase subunit B
MRGIPSGLSPFLTTQGRRLLEWAERRSSRTLPLASACCAEETRRGIAWGDFSWATELDVAPERSDVLVVAGKLSLKWVALIVETYRRMPEGRRVIAFGACAISGGLFDTYAHVQGIDRWIPVDLYVPGCPPRPEALLHAVAELRRSPRKRIEEEDP